VSRTSFGRDGDPWPDSSLGVKGHVSDQGSRSPFHRHGISLPPPADIADRSRWLGALGRFSGYFRATAAVSRASKLCPRAQHRPGDPCQLVRECHDNSVTCARARKPRSHGPSVVWVPESGIMAARAPWISSFRRYALPRFVIPFRRGLPAGCLLPWYETKPGRKIAPAVPAPPGAKALDAQHGRQPARSAHDGEPPGPSPAGRASR